MAKKKYKPIELVNTLSGKSRKDPLVLKNLNKFAEKIEIMIKELIRDPNFEFTERKKQAFSDAIKNRIDKNQKTEYLVYNEKFESIRYKIRIFYDNDHYIYNNEGYLDKPGRIPRFKVTIRVHFSNLLEKLINIAQQVGTCTTTNVYPSIGTYYFFLDIKKNKN